MTLPEAAYLEQVVSILRSHLKQKLVGVYLLGSAAYGAYEPGLSDLDVQAVVTKSLRKRVCMDIAEALTHQALPCPARRLEFVLYARSAVNPATRHPRFEMNFNTGAGEKDHLALEPAQEASHWFLLDIAVGREVGRCLFGPEPALVFAPIPRPWSLAAIADSLAWHKEHEPTSASGVLNACRGWRYALTGEWGSKLAGAAWARQQPECPAVVEHAEKRRHGGPALDASAVTEFSDFVSAAVGGAMSQERTSPASPSARAWGIG